MCLWRLYIIHTDTIQRGKINKEGLSNTNMSIKKSSLTKGKGEARSSRNERYGHKRDENLHTKSVSLSVDI